MFDDDLYYIINEVALSDIAINSSLTMRHIISSQAGQYTCEAKNSHGNASADVELTILGTNVCICIIELLKT